MPVRNDIKLVGDGRSNLSSFQDNQLKLYLSHLGNKLTRLLPGSVRQTQARRFSEFVPKILNITAKVSVRNITLTWTRPKGVRNLLFYEGQLATSGNYAQAQTQTSNEEVMVWGGLVDGLTYHSRIRVVTVDGRVGPWSDTSTGLLPIGKIIIKEYPTEWLFTDPHTYGYTDTGFFSYINPQYWIDEDYRSNGGMIAIQISAVLTYPYTPRELFDMGYGNSGGTPMLFLGKTGDGLDINAYSEQQAQLVAHYYSQYPDEPHTTSVAENVYGTFPGKFQTKFSGTIAGRQIKLGFSVKPGTWPTTSPENEAMILKYARVIEVVQNA